MGQHAQLRRMVRGRPRCAEAGRSSGRSAWLNQAGRSIFLYSHHLFPPGGGHLAG